MIKDKILSYKINRGLKKDRFLHKAYQFEKLKKIGVVFTFDDLKKHEAVKSFIKTFQANGTEVKTLAFKPKDKQNFEFYFDFFEDKDFGFLGTPKSPHMLTFLDQKFEYLFCLDEELHQYMQYVLVKAKATTRIGVFQEDSEKQNMFELMVKPQMKNNPEHFIKEIIHYIKKISGNEE